MIVVYYYNDKDDHDNICDDCGVGVALTAKSSVHWNHPSVPNFSKYVTLDAFPFVRLP